jgi:peptidoglycan/LPS O-acetylase OafA/YrhL
MYSLSLSVLASHSSHKSLHTSTALPADLSYRGHIANLDILRGCAILLVLLYHSFVLPFHPQLPIADWTASLARFGRYGVHLFFVLSGFLIVGGLLDTRGAANYYQRFYLRRALRILPAYMLLIVALKAVGYISWRYVAACVFYVANMAGIFRARSSEYGALWSLAVEEQFYLFVPWFIRKRSNKAVLIFLLAICALCILARAITGYLRPNADAYFKIWDNADYLAYGALAALLLRLNVWNADNIRAVYKRFLLGGVSTIWIFIAFDTLEHSGRVLRACLDAVGLLPAIAIFLGLLLWAVERNSHAPSSDRAPAKPSALTQRSLAFLGFISYGLYLVHPAIFETYDRRFSLTFARDHYFAAMLPRALVCVTIAIALAYLSRVFFEEPFLKRKYARIKPTTSAAQTSESYTATEPGAP